MTILNINNLFSALSIPNYVEHSGKCPVYDR
jgi:hypothetical protein